MRSLALCLAAMLSLASANAVGALETTVEAADPVSYAAFAQVVRVDPIVSRHVARVPVKRCTWEYVPARQRYSRHYDDSPPTRRIKRCRTSHESRVDEQITGYDVTLRYNGETFHRRTSEHPGQRVPLKVEVMPLDE